MSAENQLAKACSQAEICRRAAGISAGSHRRKMKRYAKQWGKIANEIADQIYGPPSAETLAMSDEELIADLFATEGGK